jgi:hypothetical protein
MKGFRFRGVTAVLVAIAATAGLALTASAASAATARPATVAAAVAPAETCVGGIDAGPVTSSDGISEQQFWWTQESASEICIGTVLFTENYTRSTGLSQRVRIWAEPANVLINAYWSSGTITSTGIRFADEIRLVQPAGLVMVCSAVVVGGSGSNNVLGGVPILCQTVGR